MFSRNATRKAFAIGALALSLALPAGVFADAGITSPINDSLTINATYVLTGLPTSVTYIAQDALVTGQVAWMKETAETTCTIGPVGARQCPTGAGNIHIIAWGGSAASVPLRLTASDLQTADGQRTITKTERRLFTANVQNGNSDLGGGFSSPQSYNPNGLLLATTANTPGTQGVLDLGMGVNIADPLQAGVFTGTLTFSVG